MEENSIETELRLSEAKRDNLRNAMERLRFQTTDLLLFNLQWKDLDDYLKSSEEKIEKKLIELQSRGFAIEERAKIVEEAEAKMSDLEMKANRFKEESVEFKKHWDFLENRIHSCQGYLKMEETRLMHYKKLVEDYVVEERSKESQRNEMVESLRKIQTELDLKGEHLVQMETDLETKSKHLSLLLDQTVECERHLETASKTQAEIELKAKELELMNTDLERYRGEVSAEKEHLDRIQIGKRELEDEIERKKKDLEDVLDRIGESGKKLEELRLDLDLKKEMVKSVNGEMEETSQKIESKAKELKEIEKLIVESNAHYESIKLLIQEHNEELVSKENKQNQLANAIASEEKTLERAKLFTEKLSEQHHETERNLELKKNELCYVNGTIMECLKDLETKANELRSLESLFIERNKQCEEGEKKMKHLENSNKELSTTLEEKQQELFSINKAIKKYSNELKSKRNDCDQIQTSITNLTTELKSKERDLDSVKKKIQENLKDFQSKEEEQQARFKASMREHEKELNRTIHVKQEKLSSIKNAIKRCSDELESKWNDRDKIQSSITNLTAEFKSKEQDLDSVKKMIQENLKDFQSKEEEQKARLKASLREHEKELSRALHVKQEKLSSIKNEIKKCSDELESKRNDHDQIQTSITDLTTEFKSKEHDLDSIKKMIQENLKDLQSKEEEQQARLKASLMEHEKELGVKEKELVARSEMIDSKDENLAKLIHDYEEKAKEMSSFYQQSNTNQHVDMNICDEKTLELFLCEHLKKCSQLHTEVFNALKESSEPAKLVLETIKGFYSGNQDMTVPNLDPNSVRRSIIYLLGCLVDMQPILSNEVVGEAIKFATEWKDATLVKVENPIEMLGLLHFLAAFSLAYNFDANKLKNLFDVPFLLKYAPSLCEALGVTAIAPVNNNNVLPLNDMPQHNEAPNSNHNDSRSHDVQENVESFHSVNGNGPEELVRSGSFSAKEVLNGLQCSKDPSSYVLNFINVILMGARQRGELGLAEPVVHNLISLMVELPRVVRSSDDIQSKAIQVAKLWSLMLGTNAQMSPIDAWGFLHLLVAYELVDTTKQDLTLKFASRVAHFKHAPRLFQSLGLTYAVPNFVRQLLNEHQYIPAIRFIFYFNLKNMFSPMEFLKEEIIKLRLNAKESQADERDGEKLRDILELIEEFKLEIDIPVDLIVKFMVPRGAQKQNQHVVFSCVPIEPQQITPPVHMEDQHMATPGANPSVPIIFGVPLSQQGQDVEANKAGGSTAFEAQSSQQAGVKRPRLDPDQVPDSVIRPCFDPSSTDGNI